MDYKALTIKTYDKSAKELAEYFRSVGPRVDEIERALSLAGTPTGARVIEIGCGDGRDAAEIIKRVEWYQGFDPSEGFLKIARNKVPNGSFIRADVLSYKYPKKLDVVYAFASLLHVNRDDFAIVCQKVKEALRKGGIFFISLKERYKYEEEIKKDQYGERMFYYYNVELVKQLAGNSFALIYKNHYVLGHTNWFRLALKRN